MNFWPFARQIESFKSYKSYKSVDEALRNLALLCWVPEGTYLDIIMSARIGLQSTEHFAIIREVAGYFGARLWMQRKGQVSRYQEQDRLVEFVIKLSKLQSGLLIIGGLSDIEVEKQVETQMDYVFHAVGDYMKLDFQHFVGLLSQKLSKCHQSLNAPPISVELANSIEQTYNLWANKNKMLFVPQTLSGNETVAVPSNLKVSFADAVNLTADFGNTFADLNDSGMCFKPESYLPAQRQRIQEAFKVSLKGDPHMAEEFRNAHNYLYPQLALFVSDSDAKRALEISNRPYVETFGNGVEMEMLKPTKLSVTYFSFAHVYGEKEFHEGQTFFNNDFFNSPRYLGRDSADAKFMRSLALQCWDDMCAQVRDWRKFVDEQSLR
jgi:hypothetical protein